MKSPIPPIAVPKRANELYDNIFAPTCSLKTIGLRYLNIFDQIPDPNSAYLTTCTRN